MENTLYKISKDQKDTIFPTDCSKLLIILTIASKTEMEYHY